MQKATFKKLSLNQAQEHLKAKKRMGADIIPTAIGAIISVVIVFPIWLLFIFPSIIFYSFYDKKQKKPAHPDLLDVETPAKDMIKQEDRKYELVLYGATGFCGGFAARYIAKQYPKLKWAISGRNQKKLEDLRKELSGIDPALQKNLDIIIVNAGNHDEVKRMVKNTRVVICSAGPMTLYCSLVVAYCAQYGTHYCDITGEMNWFKIMIEKYDNLAKKSGARIVQSCAYGCVPYDLVTLRVNNELKKKGDKMKSIYNCVEQYLNFSGGTFLTLNYILRQMFDFQTRLQFDASLKMNGENRQSINKTKLFSRYMLKYSKELGGYLSHSPTLQANLPVMQRSNALNNYNENFEYGENHVYPNVFAVVGSYIQVLVLFTMVFVPPLYNKVRSILPPVGAGPSQYDIDNGFLKIVSEGTGENGKKTKVVFITPNDVGYVDTARFLVEAGLVLALESEKVKVGGGCWTPATCQGEALADRICQTGSVMQVIE